jgi:hypothetical protein
MSSLLHVRVVGMGMRRPTVVAAAMCMTLAVAIGGPGLPSAANGSPGTTTAAATTRELSTGGYAIAVPSGFKVVAIRSANSINGCFSIKSPVVFVGSFIDLDGCAPLSPTHTFVLFGSGGPPMSPIPDIYDGEQTFHGVTVQVLIGADPLEKASYLLALFPGARPGS